MMLFVIKCVQQYASPQSSSAARMVSPGQCHLAQKNKQTIQDLCLPVSHEGAAHWSIKKDKHMAKL